MIRTAAKAGLVLFVAMLLFGGVETIGFLHHAWAWIETVIHSSTPTIRLPRLKLPRLKLPAMPGKAAG